MVEYWQKAKPLRSLSHHSNIPSFHYSSWVAGFARVGLAQQPAAAPFPPPPPKQCFRREDCGPKEICHPFGNVCMRECNSVEDCPKWLDTCAEITDPEGGSTRTPKVCKCGIAQNCNSYAGNFTCNSWDDLCEWMCKEDVDCAFYEPGRTCDKPTGQCRGSVSPCSSNRDCPAPTLPRCNLATSRCTGCVASSDCASRPDGFTACDSTGACYKP